MSKPIIKKITPFDAQQEAKISIAWNGNRSYGTRLIIYDNDTRETRFDNFVSSLSLDHLIPGHTLDNGSQWLAQVQVYDQEGIRSPLSDPVLFHTFQTPEFYFDNLPADNQVSSASFDAAMHYYSPEWENISSYRFYLYDSNRKQLLESNTSSDDDNIHYHYRGLENNAGYYIRCQGTTANGLPLDTGYIPIHVKYESPNTYARIYTTSLPSQGCVKVSSNLIMVQYNGTDSFEYENGMINLTDKTLYYDEGFLIDGDFSMIIRGINMWQTADIMRMSNGREGLTLSSRIYLNHNITENELSNQYLRFKLTVPNGAGTYLLYSDALGFSNEDMVTIYIRRKNHIYQLHVESEHVTEGNIWYGTERPAQNQIRNYEDWVDTPGKTHVADQEVFQTFLTDREPEPLTLDDLWIGGE